MPQLLKVALITLGAFSIMLLVFLIQDSRR